METKNIKSALAGVAETARSILFGKACCAACGADVFSQEYFCEHCLQTLPFNAGFVCEKCGRAIGEDYPVCLECKADMPLFDAARSAFRYEGEIVRLVKKFKTGGKYLADVFAHSMLHYLLSDFAGADMLAYVPMTGRAERKRGYNQSRLLAEWLSALSGIPLAENALEKTHETSAQKQLSRRERAENLRGSFHLSSRKIWKGKTAVLVDDVLTTGATANELARLFFGAGAKKVFVLTAASVPQRGEKTSPHQN